MFNNYKFKPYQLYFRHTANYYVISAAKIIKNANKCKKNNVQKLCILRKNAETYCVSTTFAKWQQLQQIIKNIGSLSLHFI